jgi:hypothetical protein
MNFISILEDQNRKMEKKTRNGHGSIKKKKTVLLFSNEYSQLKHLNICSCNEIIHVFFFQFYRNNSTTCIMKQKMNDDKNK